jgi:hypothetical protein
MADRVGWGEPEVRGVRSYAAQDIYFGAYTLGIYSGAYTWDIYEGCVMI